MGVAYEIGPFQLDPEAGVLSRDGAPTALGARAVAVLKTLVEHANEFVPKGRILDAAWPNLVVEEANLAVQIGAIRRVLAQAGGERWIETLAGRGYRFVGPVTKVASDRSPDAGGRAQRSTLPEALTSFIGRERELAEIKRLLPGKRLLTLVGAGGVGKTRLALQFAAEVARCLPRRRLARGARPGGGPGAGATDGGHGARAEGAAGEEPDADANRASESQATAAAAGQLRAPGRRLRKLADALLRQCPARRVLLRPAAKRSASPGEQTYRVPSLSLPDPDAAPTPQSFQSTNRCNCSSIARCWCSFRISRSPTRTRRHWPRCATASTAFPLAIELAAARVRSMSVEEIDGKLDHRFRLLTGGSRTALPRQQTLRSLIDWSYDLLHESGEVVAASALGLRRRLDAGSGGSGCAGEGIEKEDILDLLTSLADKSLVGPEREGAQTRYRLLETVRQYARDRLRGQSAGAQWYGYGIGTTSWRWRRRRTRN